MNNLYQENLLNHANSPHNKYAMLDCTHSAKAVNPNCGDSGEIFLKVNSNEVVEDVSFEASGCAVSIASFSMMTDYIKNKSISEIKQILPSDVYNLLGVHVAPTRSACALLSYNALEIFLSKYVNINSNARNQKSKN